MIFFHLKNCLFQSFFPPGPPETHAAGHAVHFPRTRCDFARNGSHPHSFFEAVSTFFTIFICRFCAFLQALLPKCTEFPLHSVQISRNSAPHFLAVQCPKGASTTFRRIRTTLQISNAKRIYRSHSNAAAHKPGVP